MSSAEKQNRYEMTNEYWRNIFLQMDCDELAERFNLRSDEDALYIRFCCRDYRIDKKSGHISDVNAPECKLSFNVLMSIYNLFYYSKAGAAVRGEFVPFREVKRASPFAPAFEKSLDFGLTRPFSGKAELLRKAGEKLEGEPINYGDVGFVVRAFDFMPVMVVFWDEDDEFPAQANMLFDADITDYIHEETVCCIAGEVMERLVEEAGLNME